MKSILVSIIIPVYNDWMRLALCLKALSEQTFSKEMFEVIIVNNNPKDAIPQNVILAENFKIIEEENAGSYAARNAGLKIAKGEILGFTDSDCIPDKNWIANAVEHFLNNKTCSRIAGKVSVFTNSLKPGKAHLYDKLYAFNQKDYVEKSGTSVTANMFAKKYVFESIGYFNESLMSGGDFSWGSLAYKKGFKIDYLENVVVNHPARENLKELIKKERRVGGSQAVFLASNNNVFIDFFNLIKELLPRYKSFKYINKNGKNLSVTDKIQIYVIRQYLLGVRAYEKFRVQTGKKANRA